MQRLERHLGWVTGLTVALCCGWIFSFPLRHPELGLAVAQDDFYYYLKIAQNLASTHRSTFDGVTLTNGYHPLYLLCLTVASILTTSLQGIFRFLWLLDWVSAVSTFLLVRGFFLRRGVNPWLTTSCALLIELVCLRLPFQQMEVTLTVPLALALLTVADVAPERFTPQRGALLGALAGLTVLSRLDSAFLVLLLGAGALTIQRYRQRMRNGFAISFLGVAGVLVGVYLGINKLWFHTLLPISGAAKQLKHSLLPSRLALHSLSGKNGLLLLVTLAGLTWLVCRRQRFEDPRDRMLLSACFLFPLLHLAALVELSDWPLWGWYSYSLEFGVLAAILVFATSVRGSETVRKLSPVSAVLLLCGLALTRYHIDPEMVAISRESAQLAAFAATHPGRYAMGDRAGMFAYLTTNPVLQTEGLTMDPDYLQHLRRQEDLRTVLRHYGVQYYVAFMRVPVQGCLAAVEPAQAGPFAAHMRSTFCDSPVSTIVDGSNTLLVYRLQP